MSMGESLEKLGLVEQLANRPGEPKSLAEVVARAHVRMQSIEAAKQRRRDEAAQAYRASKIAKAAPAPVAQPTPRGFTQGELRALAGGIAPFVAERIDEELAKALAPAAERLNELERATGLSKSAPMPGVEAIAPVVAAYVNARTGPLQARVAGLENDVMQYRGIYEEGLTYVRGTVCTHSGGMWLATETTNSKPGTNGDWKLTVKSGQAPR
jgi:hypothetical protein